MDKEMKPMQDALEEHFRMTKIRVQKRYKQEYEAYDENEGFRVRRNTCIIFCFQKYEILKVPTLTRIFLQECGYETMRQRAST